MRDLTSPATICAKGLLFLALGVLTAGVLICESRTARTTTLLGVCVWAFCRFYYFAFYVVERYVDPSFRYAGLFSLIRHAMRRGGG